MTYDSLLIHTCSLIEKAIAGEFSPETEITTANVKCRVMYADRLILDLTGNKVLSFAKVFFLKTQSLSNATHVVIEGTRHRIAKHSRHYDSTVHHHQEVWLI